MYNFWPKMQLKSFSYSNSSKTTVVKKLCKSKFLSNHRVVMLKNPLHVMWFDKIFGELQERRSGHAEKTLCRWHVTCKGFFSMTTLWFDKFFDLQSFLMMVVLLLLLYGNEYFIAYLYELASLYWHLLFGLVFLV